MCDSYVLSESSLFVQRTKLVLKTCGTTKLLAALPTIVDLVHGLGMELVHLRFSRASFLFPQCQVCHCPLAPQPFSRMLLSNRNPSMAVVIHLGLPGNPGQPLIQACSALCHLRMCSND